MIIKKMTLFFLLFASSILVKSQSADEIVTKYIAATGGAQKWKQVKTITSSGIYNYGGMEFPFKAWSKAPDHYKYEVTANGKSFTQAYDGAQGWKIDGFKNETQKAMLSGEEATAMANEADVELESPFIDYQKKGHRIVLEGKDTAGNKLCYKIKLVRKDGDTATYYFDSDNYELIKKQAVSKNAEMGNSMMDLWYSDYKAIEGIKTPQKISSVSNGQTILLITISDVKLNLPVEDSIFKP